MASSDEEIEELIEDVSVVSGDDDASVAEEIDVEGAFEGDVENSDDESIVGTKKKKLMPHTQTVDRSIESEEEDVIENQKTFRRNSKRKGPEKTEDNRKTEDDHEDKQNGEEGRTLPDINKGVEPSPGSQVRIIIEHCETPTIDDEEDVSTKELRKASEQPKLKWHERYALQKHKKWRWPKKKRELMEGEDGEEIHKENEDERVVRDDEAKFNGEEETKHKEEEEDEITEMTEEEKEDMYNAVRNGEYILLQDLLDKKNADINMLWYRENLLMVAMRAQQMEMVEFLIDNGVDYNYETTLIDLKDREKTGKRLLQYTRTCRQMAYDLGLLNVVEMIDVENNQIHKYYKITHRYPRMRRPPAPTPLCLMYSDEEEDEEEELLAGGDSDLLSNLSHVEESSEMKTDNQDTKGSDKRVELTLDRVAELEVTDDECELFYPRTNSSEINKNEKVEERPGLLRRGTKSSMGLQAHNDLKYKRRAQSKSADLQGTINSVGSYAWESRRWHHAKSASGERDSEESIPFVARISSTFPPQTSPNPAKKLTYSRRRPLSSPASFSAEIQKILGQSRLLRKEPTLPYIKPPGKSPRAQSASTTVTPWCHSNSSAVLEHLSNTKISRKIQNPRFTVNRQISLRTNR